MTPATAISCRPTHGRVADRPVVVPESYNYIGVFLTFRCPYGCPYCINSFNSRANLRRRELSSIDWLHFFERLEGPRLPVTLQGGEPGLHADFIDIVDDLLEIHQVDILTNLAFDLKAFVRRIDPDRMNRPAPYAPIRVSFHPSQFSLQHILDRILFLQESGFRVGLYGVTHPDNACAIAHAAKVCADLGIDFRTKPFLGRHNGVLYGQYAYQDACSMDDPIQCECATSELLIAPNGNIYPCHHHLYTQTGSVGNIRQTQLVLSDDFRPCSWFGNCNPCDVKIKNNRHQQFGHVSMRIRFPAEKSRATA